MKLGTPTKTYNNSNTKPIDRKSISNSNLSEEHEIAIERNFQILSESLLLNINTRASQSVR